MKRVKWSVLALAVFALVLAGGVACKKKGGGGVSTEEMMSLLPSGAQLVIGLDFHRFSQMSVYDKMLAEKPGKTQEKKLFNNPEEFQQKTGIDMKKDVHFFLIGMYGQPDQKDAEWGAIANIRYDAAKVEKTMTEKVEGLRKETYNGKTIFLVQDTKPGDENTPEKKKDAAIVLLTPSTIAMASPNRIRSLIDLADKKGSSMATDAVLKKHMETIKRDGLFWMVMPQLPDALKKKPEPGQMISFDLTRAEAFVGTVDFKNAILSGEFRLICPDENANKQLEGMLNGLKGMGAMIAAKEPDLGELLNKITITASAGDLKLAFALPEDLLNRLGAKAKDKASGFMKPGPEAPATGEGLEGTPSEIPPL